MSGPSWLKNEKFQIALRSLGTYFLCLGIFYFYDQTMAQSRNTSYGLLPYIVITVWFIWIFIHNRVLIGRLIFRKRIFLYIVLLLAGLAATTFIQLQIVYAYRKVMNPVPDALIGVTFYTFLGALLYLAFLYIRERKDFYQMATLKKEVELQQLKNQLNPHFLFNSLNNIYSYNLENNTYGNDLILKLSQLMRFLVESTREDSIALKEEIDFIENYIAFEKERLGYRCDIQYDKKLSFTEKRIPPLLLFPFVENAFKHGTDTIEQSTIEIHIEDSKKSLEMSVSNSIIRTNGNSTRAGLSNVGRRLELLFPGKHRLHVEQNTETYSVNLRLELS